MEIDPIFQSTVDETIQAILLASSQHDIPTLRKLLHISHDQNSDPANVQDPETGFTPLHAAIAACEPSESSPSNEIVQNGHLPNGHQIGPSPEEEDTDNAGDEIELARDTIRLLLQNGALWDRVNSNRETPGCLARRLKLEPLYEVILDAGVRAELLKNQRDQYERIDDDQDEDGNGGGDREVQSESIGEEKSMVYSNSNGIFNQDQHRIITTRTVDLLCPKEGARVLNIGFDGLADSLFEAKSPSAHHIIEVRPERLAQMQTDGWNDKSNVITHDEQWQHMLPQLIDQRMVFDAILFNPVPVSPGDIRVFLEEFASGLLDEGGRWSFINVLGLERQIFYDVSRKVFDMSILEAGFDVDWENVRLGNSADGLQEETSTYGEGGIASLLEYYLPIIQSVD
jgi:type IV protein arginine methyltransferase